MDRHNSKGMLDFDHLPSEIFNFEGCYTIPYRCYCSRDVENLMLAGRDISTSKMAFTSTRVMGICAVGGQAVGTAAALALRYKVTQMVYDAMFTNNAHAKPGDETAFVSGNVAMSRETYSYMKNMVNGEVDFEWDLVPLPYGDAGKDANLYTGYAFWCANAYSEHKDLAADLIRFVTMPEAQLEWCKTFMTPRKSVMNSDAILNPGEGYPSAEHIKAAYVDSIVERPLARYTGTTEWTLFCTTVQQYYEMILAGAYNVEDGIAAMKADCEQYLNH